MPTYTTNYNIPKPVPGADADTWGAGLNTGMDIIDTQLAGRVTTASLGAGVATFLTTPTSANLAAALTDETGTGANVFATSPTLVTPILGTPTSGTLTNCTGLPISTGVSGLATGVAAFLATPTSANLAAALTDETGTGANVFATSPTLATPTITTNATVPLLIGGTGTTSTLTLRSTSGVGTTGADIIFQAGTNGASEIMRLLNGGNVLINRASTDSPANKLDVQSTSVRFYSGGSTTDTNCHVGNSDVAGGQGGFITFHASAATPYLSINALSQGVAHRNISLAPSGGNVGIGATSPATKLHVLTGNPGSANEVARFQGGTNNANFRNYISCYTTNAQFWWELSNEDSAGAGSSNGFAFRERSAADPSVVRLYLASGGNVGIGTSTPAYQLQLSTDSAAKPTTNTWTIASDARLKTVRGDYEKGLTEICALRPVRYEYNGKGGFTADGKEQISILAQELMQVFPECVDTFKGKLEEDGPEIDLYNYNGHAITFALINAIKELKAKIDILEARN